MKSAPRASRLRRERPLTVGSLGLAASVSTRNFSPRFMESTHPDCPRPRIKTSPGPNEASKIEGKSRRRGRGRRRRFRNSLILGQYLEREAHGHSFSSWRTTRPAKDKQKLSY